MAPVASAALTVGQRAISWAAVNAPSAIAIAKDYVAKSGKTLDGLATSGKVGQFAAITALSKGGADIEAFTRSGELTDAELKQFEAAFRKIRQQTRTSSDSRAIATGEGFAERMTRHQDIEEACRMLGVSPSQLYRVHLVMNTLTASLIEEHEALLRQGIRL